jgi:hypothetical protein
LALLFFYCQDKIWTGWNIDPLKSPENEGRLFHAGPARDGPAEAAPELLGELTLRVQRGESLPFTPGTDRTGTMECSGAINILSLNWIRILLRIPTFGFQIV